MNRDSAHHSDELRDEYRRLSQLAVRGEWKVAGRGLANLLDSVSDPILQARIQNDLGVLATVEGRLAEARQAFSAAASLSPSWSVPRDNQLRLIRHETGSSVGTPSRIAANRRTRIAIVSLLFNWPSTGGGTVHTAETAKFLTRAGYEVRHFVIGYGGWSVGNITDTADWPVERLDFDESHWQRSEIQRRIREAVDRFAPDSTIVTDSWSFKPRLAEALVGVRYFLRLAAQECLCPLNNVRLLWDSDGATRACPQHQLATPAVCSACVRERSRWSGELHRAERELAGFTEPDYDNCLRQAFAGAAGVLVVNPLIAELVKPYAPAVHVVPSGFDPARFPLSPPREASHHSPVLLLFAGLVDEPMKGFTVLQTACRALWSQRQDFRLLVTADPPGRVDNFTEFVGWQSQADLPRTMRKADIVICPTIAEEALGRTAVEAMGAGRPVVASRIGGLLFTVLDEATGLLCEPGDPTDLARQLVRLLDDPDLRKRLGDAGRRRFEQHYTWDVILNRHYRQFLGAPIQVL